MPAPGAATVHGGSETVFTYGASGRSSGSPTAAPTRSRTCGRSARCGCSPPRSSPPCATATTPRPGAGWRWRRPWPASASATRACTSRTPTPTRSPGGSRTSGPRTTRRTSRRPKDYPQDEPMVPHGMAVSLTAPEAFRFTFDACPERHVQAAELLAPGQERPNDDAGYLPAVLVRIMRDVGIPNGVGGVGYGEGDIPALVEGTMKQQRLLDTAPRPVTEDDAAAILARSLLNW